MITVKAVGYIKAALGRDEVTIDVDRMEVRRLLEKLSRLAKNRSLSLDVANTLVLVNGVEVSALHEEKTEVRAGDTVTLIPVTHGG